MRRPVLDPIGDDGVVQDLSTNLPHGAGANRFSWPRCTMILRAENSRFAWRECLSKPSDSRHFSLEFGRIETTATLTSLHIELTEGVVH